MVPQFNGGAYVSTTPNNGNPNTVYNTKPMGLTNEAIPYMPAFAQPLGGEWGYRPGDRDPPMPGVVTMAPTQQPQPASPVSSWAKPPAPYTPPPPQRGMTTYGNLAVPQITDTNADTRSPVAITLPQVAAPSDRLGGTPFGNSQDYWRSRLTSLQTTLPMLPIPGVTPPPGQGTAPPQPPPTEAPAPRPAPRPVVPPRFNDRAPDADGIRWGRDNIDYGRSGMGMSPAFASVGRNIGLSGPEAERFSAEVFAIRADLTPAEQQQLDADVDAANNPDATPEEKESTMRRLMRWVGARLREVDPSVLATMVGGPLAGAAVGAFAGWRGPRGAGRVDVGQPAPAPPPPPASPAPGAPASRGGGGPPQPSEPPRRRRRT